MHQAPMLSTNNLNAFMYFVRKLEVQHSFSRFPYDECKKFFDQFIKKGFDQVKTKKTSTSNSKQGANGSISVLEDYILHQCNLLIAMRTCVKTLQLLNRVLLMFPRYCRYSEANLIDRLPLTYLSHGCMLTHCYDQVSIKLYQFQFKLITFNYNVCVKTFSSNYLKSTVISRGLKYSI